eukprot:EG_transcript_10613
MHWRRLWRGHEAALRRLSSCVCQAHIHTRAPEFSIMTLNVHAPIYKRLPDGTREADHENLYLPRNERIIQMLLQEANSVICLQEFWVANAQLVALYQARLQAAGYTLYVTPRTGDRGDGLCTAVALDRFRVLDRYNIPFKDVGDRVAHLVHLEEVGSGPQRGELLLVNVHLMFPHNTNCTVVRLRQAGKMLYNLKQYLDYKALANVPIVICGDWNGTSRGHLAGFMRSQGFISVYDEQHPGHRWVSHLNHNATAVGVDCIWLLNPSAQAGSLTANWMRTACMNIAAHLSQLGIARPGAAFAFFDTEGRGTVTFEEFFDGVRRLGLTGEHSIGLLPHEIEELVQYCDADNDGVLAPQELLRAVDVEAAAMVLEQVGGDMSSYLTANAAASCPIRGLHHPYDLQIRHASLPPSFGQGIWPEGYRDEISDHAPLTAILGFPPATAPVAPSAPS